MATWIDPEFGPALQGAALIASATVVSSSPQKTGVRLDRVFAGRELPGSTIDIKRAAVIGHGHANDRLPTESFVFIVRADPAGGYIAETDTYWHFRISEGIYVHIPVRDPFTKAYVPFEDFAAIVACVREPANAARAPFLQGLVARLRQTPVAATQPIEVNLQVYALETLHLLAQPGEFIAEVKPFLDSPHFQVRWSAIRAVQQCGRGQSTMAPLLLRYLITEQVPPVQAAIAEALFLFMDSAQYCPFLEQALPRMYAKELLLSQNIMNPVMNMLPAPQLTIRAILLKLNGEPGDLATLRDKVRRLAGG